MIVGLLSLGWKFNSGWQEGGIPARDVSVETDLFSGNLSVTDEDLQTALETLDAMAGGTPGGANTQVQFNDGGSFNGESSFTYNKALNSLAIDRLVIGPAVADYLMPTTRGAAGEVPTDNGAGNVTWQPGGGTGLWTQVTSPPAAEQYITPSTATNEIYFSPADGFYVSWGGYPQITWESGDSVHWNQDDKLWLWVIGNTSEYSFSATTFDARSNDIETTGSVTGGRVFKTAIYHAYGGYEDKAYTLSLAADTWTQITNGTNDLWTGSEVDGITFVDDDMTILNSGDYTGVVTLTISALNGKDFHVRLYNTTQSQVAGFPLGISTTGAGNEMQCTVPIYMEATANDVYEMQINSTDGTDPILDDAIFYVQYLHD